MQKEYLVPTIFEDFPFAEDIARTLAFYLYDAIETFSEDDPPDDTSITIAIDGTAGLTAAPYIDTGSSWYQNAMVGTVTGAMIEEARTAYLRDRDQIRLYEDQGWTVENHHLRRREDRLSTLGALSVLRRPGRTLPVELQHAVVERIYPNARPLR